MVDQFIEDLDAVVTPDNTAIIEVEQGGASFKMTRSQMIADMLPKSGGAMTGAITTTSTVDGRDVSTDGDKLDNIAPNANDYTHPNHSGDVTSTADGPTVIASNAVTLSKMADMATQSFIGRDTATTGDPEILSAATARTILNVTAGAEPNVVDSVFTRTGAVVSAAGDYTATQITNTPAGNIVAITVQTAIDELDTEKLADITGELFTDLSDVNVNSTFNRVLPHWNDTAGEWKDDILVTSDLIIHNCGTSVVSGGVISIDVDTTKFDITAYHGIIIDGHTDPEDPTLVHVRFSAQNALTVTNLVADFRTHVGIRLDNVVPSGGSATAITATVDGVGSSTVYLVQSPNEYTQSERRDITVLGQLVHPASVIAVVVPLIQHNANPSLQLTDLTSILGPLNGSGNVYSANGANLNIDKTAGQSFREGINIDGTAAGYKRPDISDDPSFTALTFRYRYQDGSGGISEDGDDTTINPGLYDDGDGTLGTVGSNKWTIQQLWMFPGTGTTRIMYGQVIYNSLAEAESGLTNGVITDPALVRDGILRGWLLVRNNATDLSDTATTKFISASKFVGIGGAGSATGEINTASNVGTDGLGVFKQKTGVDLEFKHIAPASTKISVVANGDDIDLDVVPGNINTADLNDDGTFLKDILEDTTPQAGGDFDMNGNQMQWSKGADVASATALPVLTDGNYFDVTGTTTITSINTTGGAGTLIKLHFDGILTLTHHATDLILPGAANITTAAGDEFEFVEYAAGDYRCTGYALASGEAIVGGGGGGVDYITYGGTVTAAPVATGEDAIAFGDGADAGAQAENIAIGKDADASSTSGNKNIVVIGQNAASAGTTFWNTVIGSGASVTGSSKGASTVIGYLATSNQSSSVAIGKSTSITGAGNSVAIGEGATTTANAAISIGINASCVNADGIAIGAGASSAAAANVGSVAIGRNVTTDATYDFKIHAREAGGTIHAGFSGRDGGAMELEGSSKQWVMPSYAVASLPTGITGGMIFITDETGGAIPAFYDGTNWRRVTDRAIAS